jgi:hypothetical protein
VVGMIDILTEKVLKGWYGGRGGTAQYGRSSSTRPTYLEDLTEY